MGKQVGTGGFPPMDDPAGDAGMGVQERFREPRGCPFCGEPLRRVVSKARSFQPPRDYIEWHHDAPSVNCYIFNKFGPIVASTGDNTRAERDFLAAWNSREIG